jgi:hypothetical protein
VRAEKSKKRVKLERKINKTITRKNFKKSVILIFPKKHSKNIEAITRRFTILLNQKVRKSKEKENIIFGKG